MVEFDRLAQLQLQRLRSLLQHAQQHVPYYRDLFARTGFEPAAVTSLADLQRLPFLGKAEISANPDALKADNAVGLARFHHRRLQRRAADLLHRHSACQP